MVKSISDTGTFSSFLDFVIEVYKEKIPGKGEDGFMYSVRNDMGMTGVFDGLGGSGAMQYKKYQNKTGAYMASRAVSGACREWFSSVMTYSTVSAEMLKEKIKKAIEFCDSFADQPSPFSGSMIKSFPTTMAAIVCDAQNLICFWCGDSRCYLLDSAGLKQLTKDDVKGDYDAMEDVGGNSPMSQVISASKDFPIHSMQIAISKPCIIFTATDGCFAYLPTPMNFELMLIETLRSSKSVSEWENKITDYLSECAGDDFTLTGFSCGFKSFEKLKNSFSERENFLHGILLNIESKSDSEKYELWKMYYKKEYEKYMKEG